MGLLRILFLFIIGYFAFKLLKAIFLPKTQDKVVNGEAKQKSRNNFKNVEDADYEELE
jgi:hypothetical protein